MSYSYIFHELAQEDYEISVTWYAERSKLAAQGFIKAINDALLLICAHPSGLAKYI
jgi:plasmid stabilization system protein ParE